MVKSIAKAVSRLISTLSSCGAILAGIALIVIATSVVIEVISRGVFNHPVLDIVTIGRMGMGMVGLLAAAYALRMGRHVGASFIVERLPKRVGKIVNLGGLIIAFFLLILLVWGTFKVARFSQVHGIQFEGFYLFPVYLPQMLVPLGLGLFALELIVLIISHINAVFKKVDDG